MAKKIVISGASGFIGRRLCRYLADAGYEILALSRNPAAGRKGIDERAARAQWDGKDITQLQNHIKGAFGIVNLAGENIGTGRWSRKKKQTILQSRLTVTSTIARAIKIAEQKPQVAIQASAIGYYGSRCDEPLTEESPAGNIFLSKVCQRWEQAIQPITDIVDRLIIVRLAAVLGDGGGVIASMMPAFKYYLGGRLGNGRNWLSWIHIADVCGAILFLFGNEKARGIFNLSAPHPLQSREFARIFGATLHRPVWLPVPSWALKLVLGQMAEELILASQKVYPDKLLSLGYQFLFPGMQTALEEIFGKS